MSTVEQQTVETIEQRVERELASLRQSGFSSAISLPAITRSAFNKLTPQSRVDFCKAGGKLLNDPEAPKQPLPEGAMTRSKFDALRHPEKMEFIKKGGQLVDEADYLPGPDTSETVLNRGVLNRQAFRDLPLREQIKFLDAGGTVTD
jgi:hypothetical protein